MRDVLTLEGLGLPPKAGKVANHLIGAVTKGGSGWCCGIALRHPKVGGHGMTMRMTEVSRAIGARYGMDPLKAVEREWCNCVMRCRHRLDNGGERVLAYRIAPELHDLVLAGREGRAAA